MKKRLQLAAVLLLAAIATFAGDVTILLDVSESVVPIYSSFERLLLEDILPETVEPGDTVHLITFADTPQRETSLNLGEDGAVRSLVDTLFLLNPFGDYTDLIGAFEYLADYVESLAEPSAVIILTDGIHDPPPGSRNAGLSQDDVRNQLEEQSRRIRDRSSELRLLTYGAGAIESDANGAAGAGTTGTGSSNAGQDANAAAADTSTSSAADSTDDTSTSSAAGSTDDTSTSSAAGSTDDTSTSSAAGSTDDSAEDGAAGDAVDTTGAAAESESASDAADGETSSDSTSGAAGSSTDGDDGETTSDATDTSPAGEAGDGEQSEIGVLEETLETDAEVIEPEPIRPRRQFPWGWFLVILALIGVGALAYFLLRNGLGHAVPSYHTHSSKKPDPKSRPIRMDVLGQNKNIGSRNINWIGTSSGKSVGGKNSHYLIFVVKVPPRIGMIVCGGEGDFTFVPKKAKYFPDLDGPLHQCLDKRIRIRGEKGQEIEVMFTEWISPLEQLNRIMHLVDRPGLPDEWEGDQNAPGGVVKGS